MSGGGYMLDGKPVKCWLFGRQIVLPNGRQIPQLVQVEGFDLDHAWRRLLESSYAANSRRADWEMLDELGPEHDLGYLGEKLPLLPGVVLQPSRFQH